MDPVTVAWWRNIAGLLLMFEFFVLCLPSLILFFFAVKGMRALRARLGEIFPLVKEQTLQVEKTTRVVSHALITPPIRVRSVAKGVAQTAQVLVLGKRLGNQELEIRD